MEMPHDLPYSEVTDLLQAIIQTRAERNKHKGEKYRKKDAELDALLELLAQRFMSAPTRGMMIMEERPLPRAEEEDVLPPISSHFDTVQELRRAVPDSKNETPADLDTTPREEETPEEIRERERLIKLFEGGNKISAYSMKSSLYNTLKNAPSTLYRSISSVSKKVVKPFKKGMKSMKKSMKTKKYKKYRKN